MINRVMILSLLFVSFCMVLFAESPTMAVFGFESSTLQKNSTIGYTKILESLLFDKELFKIVDRQSIEKILEEQKLNATMLVDKDNNMIEAGKIAGAKYITIGSIEQMPTSYVVSLKIMNVSTGMIVFSDTRKYLALENTDNEINEILNKIRFDENYNIIKDNSKPENQESNYDSKKEENKLIIEESFPINQENRSSKNDFNFSEKRSPRADFNLQLKRVNWSNVVELDAALVPKYGVTMKNSEGEVIGNFGINLSLGFSQKRYYKPVEYNKMNSFWRVGTLALIVPYAGIGVDYIKDDGLFFGIAVDLVIMVIPTPTLTFGQYF